MKAFQEYLYDSKKKYEFRIKVVGADALDKGAAGRIKQALEAFEVDTITAPRSVPVQEHREFPKMGPCEASIIDVTLTYPTIAPQVRQLVSERAGINAECVCVYTKAGEEYNEEFEAYGKDHEGALLDEEQLKDVPGGQSLVGPGRLTGLLKELETRKYEVAGSDNTIGGVANPAHGKTTNDLPTGDKSPVGGQNKIVDVNAKG